MPTYNAATDAYFNNLSSGDMGIKIGENYIVLAPTSRRMVNSNVAIPITNTSDFKIGTSNGSYNIDSAFIFDSIVHANGSPWVLATDDPNYRPDVAEQSSIFIVINDANKTCKIYNSNGIDITNSQNVTKVSPLDVFSGKLKTVYDKIVDGSFKPNIDPSVLTSIANSITTFQNNGSGGSGDPAPTDNSSNMWIWLLLVFIVLVIIVAVVGFIFYKKKHSGGY
jgi:hypothetical protein